ncbi:hotdog domain-containing protein [Tsukamurella sp. 8F]|uniref:hotdog domain-containing protein n=1 Tax=unclassified Tsukamurella TaxID=2633480 RepID=UPI0023B9F2B9|nr:MULTISPECIES: hotdog domain-containing protein [unclassified Tsukamurella]MDF0530701.1 hotdog domain-containing protein [Tsukamurella sp. 8J]MDF0587902.1 hotdog domain-containing protein [Tsukamurella sp. 8F]
MTEATQSEGGSAEESGDLDRRSDFPRYRPATPPDSFGPFVESMRRLQDLAVSVDAPGEILDEALQQANALIGTLEPYEAREGRSPAGRVVSLPGRGSLLMPPWSVEKFDAESVRATGVLRRYHLGGGGVAHGGVLPLVFDDNFGMIVYAARRPISRTAFLHVDYRKVTPLNEPLVVEGSVTSVEGRKTFVSSKLTTADGTLLAEAHGLMVQLLPGQP